MSDAHKWLVSGERLIDDTPHVRDDGEDPAAAAARELEEERVAQIGTIPEFLRWLDAVRGPG